MKLLKENIGEKSDDNEFGNDFWILHPDHGQQKKTQTSQTSLKLKILLHQKTISAERKGNMEYKKIFVNHIFNKGLISRIYKELNDNNKK